MSKRKVTAEQIEDSLAKWCAVLAAPSVAPDKVPPGWFTIAQLAKQIDRSICNTSQRVSRMVAEGKAEKKLYRIQLQEKVRPVPHYRLLK